MSCVFLSVLFLFLVLSHSWCCPMGREGARDVERSLGMGARSSSPR